MRRGRLATLVVAAALAALLTAAVAVARVGTPHQVGAALVAAKCSAAEYRQFDFFAGDWDTYDVEAPVRIVARNRVTPMLDGCALREVYEQGDGLRGESFSTYDAARRRWHQSWATNRGQLLLMDGRLEGERMVLTGTERTADGTSSVIRVAWWPERGGVREKAERSGDQGTTWTTLFDIVFRPHGAARGG